MIDKRLVAASFGKAAASYDQAARLQRLVGETLLGMIPPELVPHQLLDLGCGTGYFTRILAQRFPAAKTYGLDLSQGMLDYAARHSPEDIAWIGGDAEQLPLADASLDLVFSSLVIQWCPDLLQAFREMRRVVAPGGRVLFATLAEDTLWELREAWKQVDNFRHVNDFLPFTEICHRVESAGFDRVQIRQEQRVLEYAELRELTGELKSLGAVNLNPDRPPGMTGRQRALALRRAYEGFRNSHGRLPATWHLVWGSLEV